MRFGLALCGVWCFSALVSAQNFPQPIPHAIPPSSVIVPVTGVIDDATDHVCFDLAGNTSARISFTGTFVAWYRVTGYGRPGCEGLGAGLHGLTDYYEASVGVSNQTGTSQILQPMDGIQSVRVSIYGSSPPYGYTSGAIEVEFSATMAPSTGFDWSRVHFRGAEMSTRPACHAASPCSPPAVSPVAGAAATLTMRNIVSHNIYLTGLIVRALDACGTGTITIIDGGDGEAVNFGAFSMCPTGASWTRFANPLYVAAGGNNLMVHVTGSPEMRWQINAIGVRK